MNYRARQMTYGPQNGPRVSPQRIRSVQQRRRRRRVGVRKKK